MLYGALVVTLWTCYGALQVVALLLLLLLLYKSCKTCTTVVQVLRVLLQLLVVAAIMLSFTASFIACFILLVIAP